MAFVEKTNDLATCHEIRRSVFIVGQNVPEELEVDGLDDESVHYIVTDNAHPVGTARVRMVGKKAKIERVAILAGNQGKGLGKLLMQKILSDIKQQSGLSKAVLGSQTHAVPFYRALGFHVVGEEYMDAGIPHFDMEMHFR